MTISTARCSLLIHAAPAAIVHAFVAPDMLTRFWLDASSAPLRVGVRVHWHFMVAGAAVDTTATRIDPDSGLAWDWSDGTRVAIDLAPRAGATAVTIVHDGYQGSADAMVAAALDATEGFAYVLSDLKHLLERGTAGGIVRDKARLIGSCPMPCA